ncbi:hypothetical protein Micbo1qcDRAFT_47121 [Microdochium bolleyi]|uniref:Uncharacterized protein n=1 Tax=Microdochium bolleyi TaxID=196109 RepID=A0A136JCS9_9PEZI|nr:hypothetical protein Micbo1qcDRAFT_47121 [Microdochium bolleyi]
MTAGVSNNDASTNSSYSLLLSRSRRGDIATLDLQDFSLRTDGPLMTECTARPPPPPLHALRGIVCSPGPCCAAAGSPTCYALQRPWLPFSPPSPHWSPAVHSSDELDDNLPVGAESSHPIPGYISRLESRNRTPQKDELSSRLSSCNAE